MVARHILVLPITLCLGPLVEVLGCNGLGFDDNGHLVNYKPKNMHNMGPNVLGHHPSFFLEKNGSGQGQIGKRKKAHNTFVLPAITTRAQIMWGLGGDGISGVQPHFGNVVNPPPTPPPNCKVQHKGYYEP